jgi:phospholipid/cholesterol/gamma-HCH transport system substrate-binding protein
MHLNRPIIIRFVTFIAVAVIAGLVMLLGYMKVPALLGVGRYTVTVQLPRAAGLYPRGNVTYRGTEVGTIQSVNLTDAGVSAVLSLKSDIKIPADLDAQVHSQLAIGEQYIALLPRSGNGAALKDHDVIPQDRTSVPPDINSLIAATNRGLEAIPGDNLKTTVDEAFTAVGGLGPELSRLVRGSTRLAIDARDNLDSVTTLIDLSAPVLNTQTATATAVNAWTSHLADLTQQLKAQDADLAGFIDRGVTTADEARRLIDRVQPSVPILLANLVSLGQVAVTYQPAVEQLLVLLPQAVAIVQGTIVANHDTKQHYRGVYLDIDLNLNLPPPCTTGFLPAQQRRTPDQVDYPDRPAGDLYCRVPQDSPFNVRGARNNPCLTVPGKRAPTVKMCESKEEYVPLNDGYNWKGDPNATLSGQGVPQLPPGTAPAPAGVPPAPSPPPIAAAEYDPATGTYVGPDGHVYTQADLAPNAHENQTWQSMLAPPGGH